MAERYEELVDDSIAPEAGAGLIVLLHGLDHTHRLLLPLVRALRILAAAARRQDAHVFGVRVVAPYRGAEDVAGASDLSGTVAGYYAPLAALEPGLPIVTIGESLGAAIAEAWQRSEPRIVHQIRLDPLPAHLDVPLLDRILVAAAMLFEILSVSLRKAGLNLTRSADAVLTAQSAGSASRAERIEYGGRKMRPSHVRRSIREAWLIVKLALWKGPRLSQALGATTIVLAVEPPLAGWIHRSIVGPLMERLAECSARRCTSSRLLRARSGSHFNLAEMAAPYAAWEAAAALIPCLEPDRARRLRAFIEDRDAKASFFADYWAQAGGEAEHAPEEPVLLRAVG